MRHYKKECRGGKPIEFFKQQDDKLLVDELTPQIDYGEVDLDIFSDEHGIDIEKNYDFLINAYLKKRLILREGLLRLTKVGRFWKSNMALAFILSK
jgi:hypothetical protein